MTKSLKNKTVNSGIRIANKLDVNAILTHRKQCLAYLSSYQNIIEPGDTKGYLIVFEFNNQIVGSARLDISGSTGTITRVVTDLNYRSSGVGSSLVKHLINKAHDSKLSTLKLRCLAANYKFYEKLGFNKDGKSYLENNQKYYNMKLHLS